MSNMNLAVSFSLATRGQACVESTVKQSHESSPFPRKVKNK